jgi:beta-glucanase (GH16 family)
MKTNIVFCLLLLAATAIGSGMSCSRLWGKGQAGDFDTLVWADEFDYSGLPDSTRWGYDLGDGCPNLCGWGNAELQYYTADAANARVENGNLVIECHRRARAGRDYTSARLVSRDKGDWKYGRIEVRAKLPQGRGTWPAIWMLPTRSTYGGWPNCGEIDIMEHVGYAPDSLFATVHTGKYNHLSGTQKGVRAKWPEPLENVFRVYSIEWDMEKIGFFADGKRYFHYAREAGAGPESWPFDQQFHLILNLAVGGNWAGKYGIDETIWPQRMEIDYVRVYQ